MIHDYALVQAGSYWASWGRGAEPLGCLSLVMFTSPWFTGFCKMQKVLLDPSNKERGEMVVHHHTTFTIGKKTGT